jgi:hypothetical protein
MSSTHVFASRLGIPLAALIAAFVLAVSPCHADKKEQAKAKFKEGMELIAKENYLGALQAFEASYKILPKTALLYNIGMCQKALFRYVDSIATFELYLEKTGDKVKPEMKAAVDQALAEMGRLVGRLRLVDAPNEAEVLVDGKPAGKTPFTEPLILDPGQHTIQISLDGHRTLRTDVTVASGAEAPLRAALTPVDAWIEIECDDEKAVVRIDGKVVGSCPYEGEVAPGSHTVVVTAPDTPDFEQEVQVAPGGTTSVAVSLTGEDVPGIGEPEDDSGVSPLMIGGISALALGVGAGVMGAVFHAKGTKDEETLKDEQDNPDKSKYDDAKSALKTDQVLTIVGYSLAGALIATGVVLLVVDGQDGETQEGDVAIVPAPGGLAVTF